MGHEENKRYRAIREKLEKKDQNAWHVHAYVVIVVVIIISNVT